MGLFSKKDGAAKKSTAPKAKAPAKKSEPKAEKPASAKGGRAVVPANIIKNPRITEKAAHISDKRVYTFDVVAGASKQEIAKAILAIYKVAPVRVNVVAVPTKRVFRKNHIGVKGGGRKAYVTLKEGDKIEFI